MQREISGTCRTNSNQKNSHRSHSAWALTIHKSHHKYSSFPCYESIQSLCRCISEEEKRHLRAKLLDLLPEEDSQVWKQSSFAIPG